MATVVCVCVLFAWLALCVSLAVTGDCKSLRSEFLSALLVGNQCSIARAPRCLADAVLLFLVFLQPCVSLAFFSLVLPFLGDSLRAYSLAVTVTRLFLAASLPQANSWLRLSLRFLGYLGHPHVSVPDLLCLLLAQGVLLLAVPALDSQAGLRMLAAHHVLSLACKIAGGCWLSR